VAGASILALALGEIVLRVAGIGFPSLSMPDADLGWKGRPHASGRSGDEGHAIIQMNATGFRDGDHARRKPPGVLRVAVVGDSFTEAGQVAVEATFWSVLERQLTACGAARPPGGIEVLAFGQAGYGTAQELILVEEHVLAYDPDVVVLAFFQGNDVENNSRALFHDPLRPYFELHDGKLVEDVSFRTDPVYRRQRALYALTRHLRIAQVLKRGIRNMQASRAQVDRESHLVRETSPEVYGEPTTREWREAWSVTEALLRRMRDRVEAHGAQFVLASLSTGLQVLPDSQARARLAAGMGARDLDYTEKRLGSFAEREGIAYCPLSPGLRRYAEEHGEAVHGFLDAYPNAGHWNETGHRVAGEILARWLCPRLAQDPQAASAILPRSSTFLGTGARSQISPTQDIALSSP
jgi:hypothetical protein